jgi:hypothetical protein
MPGTSGTILTLSAPVLALVLAGTAGVTAGTTAGVVVGTMAGTMVGVMAGTMAGEEVSPTSTAHQLGGTTSSTTRSMFTMTTMSLPLLMVLAD